MQKKPYKDYSGIKIDKLTFIKRVDEFIKTKWILACECGNQVIRRPNHVLNNNNFKSCGCVKKYYKTKESVFIKKIFESYKKGAKRRNFVFEVDIEYFSSFLTKKCHYCGIEPLQKIKSSNNYFLYNGVDRKNSKLGYIKNNLVPCCFICNRGKSNMNYDDFINYLKRVSKFNNNILKHYE